MKKIVFSLLLITSFCFTASAQKEFGIATSNWGGLSSLYLNPANIADSREKFCIELFSINAGVDNTLGKINTTGISKFINGSSGNISDVFNYSDNAKFSMQAPSVEIRGPGFMAAINRKNSIAVTTRIRGINQFNNFDKSLYRTVTDTTYTTNGNVDINSQNFNWTAHLWAEAALTYAAVVLETKRSELKVGVTARYLGGIGYIGMKGRNMDMHFSAGQDSFYARNTDLEYASNILSPNGALKNGLSNNDFFNQFLSQKSGNGLGGDIGIVYDYLENGAQDHYDMDGKTNIADQSKNRYKLRLSAAITDLGYITYKSDNNYNVNVTGNGYITPGSFVSNAIATNSSDFIGYARKQGFTADTGRTNTKVYMPTTLMFSADYHAWSHVYVNATYMNNVVNRQNFGNSYYNQVTVTPRYDTRLYSIAVPVTYSALTQGMKVGLALRIAGFFVGSDDALLLVNNRQYGVNLYAGLYVPFNKHKPKDRDNDHVSDHKDKCPDDFGTWENHGCPVKEAVDTTDNCPEASGLATPTVQDEKDTDGDGIPDSEDACPTVPGTASNHGCPEVKNGEKRAVVLRTVTMDWYNNKRTFNEDETKELNRFAGLLKEYPKGRLVVEGHTGNNNSEGYNRSVSKGYAETVKKYLESRGGIAPGRITAIGAGSAHPAYDNNTRSGRLGNKRVVIRLEQ